MEAEGNSAMQALLERYRKSQVRQPSSEQRLPPAFRSLFSPPPVSS